MRVEARKLRAKKAGWPWLARNCSWGQGAGRRGEVSKGLTWIMNEVNATVRGWAGYFHYRNCSSALKSLRYHVEERLRTHLRKRHKVKDRGAGYFRFSSRKLYDHYCPVNFLATYSNLL